MQVEIKIRNQTGAIICDNRCDTLTSSIEDIEAVRVACRNALAALDPIKE